MRTTLFKLAALAILALPLMAQDEDQYNTLGLSNGRLWTTWDDGSRAVYLKGYADHFSIILGVLTVNNEDKATMQAMIPKLTYKETIKALNTFFAVPENANIPIPGALRIIAARVSGTSEKETQKLTEEIRKLSKPE